MTNKQLRDRVVHEIGLQDIADYDETTMVDDFVYEGTIDLLARTRCTVRCVHLKTKADVGTYVLDHSILALVDVENGHAPRYRRDETSDADPSTIVVYPAGYTPRTTRAFQLIRSDLLRVQPTPSEDGEVDVWAVVSPERMVNDGDSPSSDQFGGIPTEYHDAIFLYACWKAASYADDEGAAQGERYRMQYEGQDGNSGKLKTIRQLVNKRGTSRAPRRRVNVRTVQQRPRFIG
jgi:hypothetical protein